MPVARFLQELESLQNRRRRLLAVFPHPDDESYGPAGALARAGRDPGAAAVVLCLTHGEASSMGREKNLSPPEVAELREARLVQIAKILPLDGLLVENLPDGGMVRCEVRAVAAVIAGVLKAFRPHVVIGHDPRGVNAHPDHIATHWALRLALEENPPDRFAMLAYPKSFAEAIHPRLMFPTPDEEVDAIVNLSEEETEAKEAALRVHEALVTLREDADPKLIRRTPIERYDFLGDDQSEPVDDLFARLTLTR